MAVSVTLPALGESVTEGTVTRWLKQEGETVQADEPLLEISTDKVDTEIPAPASGVLLQIKVRADETVDVGSELAIIGEPSEGGSPAPATQPAAQTQQPPAQGGSQQPAESQPQATQAQATDARPAQSQEADTQPTQAPPAPAPRHAAADGPAGAAGGGGSQGAAPPPAESGGAAQGTGQRTVSVTLPALGESVTEGTVTRWLKQEGEKVQADEPLLEISTDKVDTEIPAPASGVLLQIKVREDETVDVGSELAVIGEPSEAGSRPPAAQPAQPQAAQPPPAQAQPAEPQAAEREQGERRPAQPEAAEPPAPDQQPAPPAAAKAQPPFEPDRGVAPAARLAGNGAGPEAGAYVTPLVRRLAAEHGVDLSNVTGTGVGGRIRKQDVIAAAKAAQEAPPAPEPAPAPAPAAQPAQAPPAAPVTPSPVRGRTEKMSRLRRLIANRMVESLRVSAQLTTVVEADVTKIARLRERAKRDFEAREGVKLSFLPFFALAAVEALKQHPKLNAVIDTEKNEIIYHDAEHLGVAVDTERGLVVPVIRNAGDLNLAGIARKIADLADRTRGNKITPDELTGGTFTLTNTGSRGTLFDTPIINQPQVAILGTGAVVKRPVVVDDPELGETIAVRSVVYLALTYDHRLVDGADAARFLGTLRQRLEQGAFETELGR